MARGVRRAGAGAGAGEDVLLETCCDRRTRIGARRRRPPRRRARSLRCLATAAARVAAGARPAAALPRRRPAVESQGRSGCSWRSATGVAAFNDALADGDACCRDAGRRVLRDGRRRRRRERLRDVERAARTESDPRPDGDPRSRRPRGASLVQLERWRSTTLARPIDRTLARRTRRLDATRATALGERGRGRRGSQGLSSPYPLPQTGEGSDAGDPTGADAAEPAGPSRADPETAAIATPIPPAPTRPMPTGAERGRSHFSGPLAPSAGERVRERGPRASRLARFCPLPNPPPADGGGDSDVAFPSEADAAGLSETQRA